MKKLLVIIVILIILLTNIFTVYASSEGSRRGGGDREDARDEANTSLQNFAIANPQYAQLVAAAIELNNRNFELGFNASVFIHPSATINGTIKGLNLNTFQEHGVIAYGDPEAPRPAYDGEEHSQPWTFGFTADRN